MKTSNKLLLGFFVLIIVTITIGLVILKIELKNSGLNVSEVNKHIANESVSRINAGVDHSENRIVVNFMQAI